MTSTQDKVGLSRLIVTVELDPLVDTPDPPAIVTALATGVAVPESVGNEVGTVAAAVMVTVSPTALVSTPPPPTPIVTGKQ